MRLRFDHPEELASVSGFRVWHDAILRHSWRKGCGDQNSQTRSLCLVEQQSEDVRLSNTSSAHASRWRERVGTALRYSIETSTGYWCASCNMQTFAAKSVQLHISISPPLDYYIYTREPQSPRIANGNNRTTRLSPSNLPPR